MFIGTATMGCQNTTTADTSQRNQIEPTIQIEELKSYLAVNVGAVAFGGKVFCAYNVLGTQQQEEITTLYLWTLCQEFYQEQQQLRKGTGVSVPVSVTLENKGDSRQIIEYTIPRDGSYYGEDIKAIFPQSVWPKISPQSNQEIDEFNNYISILEASTEQEAMFFFASGE